MGDYVFLELQVNGSLGALGEMGGSGANSYLFTDRL